MGAPLFFEAKGSCLVFKAIWQRNFALSRFNGTPKGKFYEILGLQNMVPGSWGHSGAITAEDIAVSLLSTLPFTSQLTGESLQKEIYLPRTSPQVPR